MVEDILKVASYMRTLYESIYDFSNEESDLTEMKMHKLLYFAQKRHFSNFGEWLFIEDFEGWVHGPVNKKVRASFPYTEQNQVNLSAEAEYTIREVVYDYGKYSAGALRNLSHDDKAYKISRIGLRDEEAGGQVISKEDIIADIADHHRFNSFDPDYMDCEVLK